jgi:hypothetical protein
MEIEFNSSREAQPTGNQPVKRSPVATSAAESAPFGAAQSLEQSVRNLPVVRPEQVERARSLIADVKYPPQEMLNRIANLLALHLRD